MKVDIKTYTDTLINGVPYNMYEALLSVMCLGLVLLLAWKGRRAGVYIAMLLFLEYSFLLYCSTVIFRMPLKERDCDLMPFWSYKAIMDGKEQYLAENIMNVLVFVPVGILLGIVMRVRNVWTALSVGVGLSVGIEVLQFVFSKGLAEVDDVMHNTLGCLIGYGMILLMRLGYKRVCKCHQLG